MGEPSQILLGLGHIKSDLRSQGFDGREFDLIAHPIEEVEFDFGFRRKLKWMEIQQMGLDGK